MDIKQAPQGYEAWLASRVTLIPADLELKHRRMAESPFPFLRATLAGGLPRSGHDSGRPQCRRSPRRELRHLAGCGGPTHLGH